MDVVTVTGSMVAASCLTLAALHAAAWWRHRRRGSHLAFAVAAIAAAVIAIGELAVLQAETPAAYAAGYRAAQLAVVVLLGALVWLVASSLRAGRHAPIVIGAGSALLAGAALMQQALAAQGGGGLAVVMSPLLLVGVVVVACALSRPLVDGERVAAELQQAQHEMLRLHQDIAHAGRVTVMGQLATALAHEISQPLGAILRNAEAAALFLQDPSPDMAEIGAIVDDIRKDDQRASAVIQRMRALLRRQAVEMVPLELGPVLADVVALLRHDATARHVQVGFDVGARLPPIRGDRVQLQQVLLNLIINGMDALDAAGAEDRRVDVTVRRLAPQQVEVCVGDSGPGIPAGDIDRIFEAFFSTKTNGIGMGLAISRTLVEAHGGRLWAENRAGGSGANFRFTLPVAV